MAKKTTYLDAIFNKSIRDLLDAANKMDITKKDFVNITRVDDNLFLIFERKIQNQDEQSD